MQGKKVLIRIHEVRSPIFQIDIKSFNYYSRAKEIERLNEFEINSNLVGKGSWHDQYKDSPHIFVGGLPYELSEGDIITVFEQ